MLLRFPPTNFVCVFATFGKYPWAFDLKRSVQYDTRTARQREDSSLASRPSYFCSAGCIASPARGKEGLETLARFSCSLEEFA